MALALGGLRLLQQPPEPILLAAIRFFPRPPLDGASRRHLCSGRRLGQDLATPRPGSREDRDQECPEGGERGSAGGDGREPYRGSTSSGFVPEDGHGGGV